MKNYKSRIAANLDGSMVKRFFLFAFFVLVACCSFNQHANAQFSNVPVTGFNADVVANGVGSVASSTTATVDNTQFALAASNWNFNGSCAAISFFMPNSGTVNANATIASGLVYSLQPYTSSNDLRIPASGSGTTGTGTLTVTTPIQAASLYLLYTGGNGPITSGITVTVTFTDATTQVFSNLTALDWFNTTNPAISNVGRVDRSATPACATTVTGGPQLFDMTVALSSSNYSKFVQSITVQKTITTGIMNVFAVGAMAPCTAPTAQATALTTSSIAATSINGTFTAASPAPTGTGGYLVVRYPAGSGTITPPVNGTSYSSGQSLGAGTVVSSSAATTFSATGLAISTSYDFYIYTYNSATTCGGPVYFTTSPTFNTFSTIACGTFSGTIPIGPGLPNTPSGGFTSLTNAMTYISANGLGGNTILELQSGYTQAYATANETFPITFSANACIASSTNLTVRPATGVTGLIITSSNAGPTFDFNGCKNVTIDGRPGGTGSTAISVPNTTYLTIINTGAGVNSCAIQMRNDAQNNLIEYCDVQGQNTTNTASTNCGVILIANTTGANGNDNNTIDNCNVHATAGGFPAICIYSYGTTTTVAQYNDNCTISNCNIYDFFYAGSTVVTQTTAVKCDVGTNAWTITNNHIFQTATRTYLNASTQHRGFWITPAGSAGNGFTITNNFIGGNNPAGTGTYTMSSAAQVNNFWAMDISVIGGSATLIQNNTLTNFSLTSSTPTGTNDMFRFIGTANNGNITITGNTLGTASATGAVSITNTAASGTAYGIKLSSGLAGTTTFNVTNNTLAGITVTGSAAQSQNFNGIAVTAGTATCSINGNTIGSSTVANSISMPSASTSATAQSVTGINISTTTATNVTITNNTIANISNAYAGTGTAGQTRGIALASSATPIITSISGNTIKNLSNASPETGGGASSAVLGIGMQNTNAAGCSIVGNRIDSLVATASAAGVTVEGIFYSGTASVVNSISKNLIYGLDVLSSSVTAATTAIDYATGSATFSNNMIRMGIKMDGTAITTACLIRGISSNSASVNNFYFNSIYIGGSGVGTTTTNTFAFTRTAGSSTYDIRDNIFVNNRSNATTGGKHYALFFTTVNTGATVNYNVYQTSGTGGVFGNTGAADVTTYSAGWIASDVNSVSGNPQFISPTTATPDLHISPSTATPVEGAGINIASITDDFDSQSRGSFTPTDIGADASNFIGTLPSCSTVTLNAGTATASSVSACSATLTLTGSNTGVQGLSYQWQSRTPAGSGAFTNISGANNTIVTVPLSGSTTDFQCVITCNAGGSATSSMATVTATPGTASGYSPIVVTGYNHDVIANGNTGTSNPPANSTNAPVDAIGAASNTNFNFYDASYSFDGSTFPATSLPVNGQVVSNSVTGLLYNLKPAAGLNVLQLRGGGGAGYTLTDSLVLVTPQNGTSIYLLAVSGNSASTMTATVRFTDGSTQVFSGLSIPDWFNVTPFSQGGFGRVNSFGFDGTAPGGNNPRMYDITLALSPSNYSKSVKSIVMTNTTGTASATSNIINVFAVTMAVAAPTPFCGGLATSVTLFNAPSSGVTFQWKSSTTSGGPYTNVVGGSGATTTTYTNSSATGTVYYVCQVTCTATGTSTLSNEVTMSINPVPTITVSPTSANYCTGSTGVTLTASGGTSYIWSPGTGLNTTSGASVIASPSTSTSYTVTGFNNGCSSTATSSVTTIAGPILTSVTATPFAVLSGGSSTLVANASQPSSVVAYSFSQSTSTYTPLIGATVLGQSPTVDDDINYGLVNIGFNFNYHGQIFTNIGISDNCYAMLGSVTTTSYAALGINTNVLSPMNADMLGNSATHQLRYQTTGVAGSRIFTIEWFHWGKFNVIGDEYNVQIKLYEASGAVQYIYQPVTPATSFTCEVGLNGTTLTDFQNRTTATDWNATTAGGTNGATCSFSSSIFPADGLTFTWTPSATGLTYAWTPATFLGGTNAATEVASNVTASTTYTVTVTNGAGCSVSGTTTVAISGMVYDNTVITQVSSPSCTSPGTLNVPILRMAVQVDGLAGTINMDGFQVDLGGTTLPTWVSNAKIYYTGSSPVFATTTQYAITTNAGNTFGYSSWFMGPAGNAPFPIGTFGNFVTTHYFWLAYDVYSGAAACGGSLDGQISMVQTDNDNIEDDVSGQMPVSGSTAVSIANNFAPSGNSVSTCAGTTLTWSRACGYTGNYDVYLDGSLIASNISGTSAVAMVTPGNTYTWQVQNAGSAYTAGCNLQTFQTASVITPLAFVDPISGPLSGVCGNTYSYSTTNFSSAIQWQLSSNNVNFFNLTGLTSGTAPVPFNAGPGTFYIRAYAVASGQCSSDTAYSNVLTVVISAPSCSITSTASAAICPGQSATLTANGPSPYLWSTGAGTQSIVVAPGVTTTYSVLTGAPVGVTPTSITGFNADIVANGIGAANTTTTADFDGSGFYLLAPDYQFTATSALQTFTMPASNQVNSVGTPGVSYNLQSYSANNSLRLPTVGGSGTLTLTSPQNAATIYLLAAAGHGPATISATVNFTDATSQTVSGLSVPDWFFISPFAIQGLGRVTATDGISGAGTDPRFYDIAIPLNVGNYTKFVSSITVNFTAQSQTGATVNVVAASILSPNVVACSCTSSAVVTVGGPVASPTVTPSTSQCQGTPRTLNAGAITGIISGPVTYDWEPGGATTSTVVVNPASSTTYTLTISDGVCPHSYTVSVPVYDLPTVTATNTGPICLGATATLTATPTVSAPPISVGTDYVVTSIPFAPLSTAGTSVTLADDAISPAVSLGFTFNFYGVNYTQVYLSSNGFITFNSASGSGCCTGGVIPTNSTLVDNFIAFDWEDLLPPGGGTITYNTIGSVGSRIFIVSYTAIPHFNLTSVLETSQILLYEGTNVIEMHNTSVSTDGDGVGETEGVQNAGGTHGTAVPGRNGVEPWSSANQAYRFVLPPAVLVNYSWSPGGATTNPISISPSTSTSYSVTITDSHGCSASANTTVNVVLPTISCPADITVCMGSGTCSFNGSIGTATSPTQPCSHTITHAPLGPYALGTTAVTWTVTDQFNNTASCVQQVTVNDCENPVLTCPSNVTINCQDSSDPSATGSATATDNCGVQGITHSDVTTPGNCPGNYTIARTWTATDIHGNSSSCVQTITVHDVTAPVISGVPADASIACPAVPVFTATPIATDNCGSATLTFADVTVQNCGTTYSTTRTWTATDACGNVSTASQTIHVVDTVAPVISGFCFDQTLECPDSPVFCTLSATDNCSTYTLNFVDASTPTCGGSYIATRTWTATDACGNVSTQVQTITVEDLTAPVITGVGPTMVILCPDTPVFSTPVATDECASADLTYFDDIMTFCSGSYIVTRYWTATDGCGNTSSDFQQIIVLDFAAPVISGVDADASIECPQTPVWSNPTAVDGCSNAYLTYDDQTTTFCGGTYTTTRTWTATDDCNNQSQASQTITVTDNTAPVITGVNASSTIECPGAPVFSTPAATDACSSSSLNFTDVTTAGCGGSYSTTRTWTATDECGNVSTASETITVEDVTAPVITGVGADQTIECPQAPVFSTPSQSDECSASGMSFTDVTTNGCGGSYTTTRTWTATDACGNHSSASQSIHVEDHTGPVISGVGANQVLECPATITFSTPTQSDACSASNMTFATVTTPGCGTTYSQTRTWTATDACGNVTTASQTISIQDHTAPVISGVLPTQTINCPATPNFCTPVATDACNSVVVTYNDVNVAACGGTYSRTRTWTAVDACGNVTTASQTINVVDHTAPVISGISPALITIQCPATPVFGSAIATDGCSGAGMTLTFSDATTTLCGGAYSRVRTWTATDGCGNVSHGSQTVNVIDNTAPVITSVQANATIQCPATPVWTAPTATDACGTATIGSSDATTTICGGSYIRTRTWTATDGCGNHSSVSRTTTVQDLTAPVIAGVGANATINCPATPVFSNPVATDACSSVTLAFNDVTTTICGGSYSKTRTWTATDACGNHSSASQTITVQDVTAPVITGVGSASTIQCPASPAFSSPTATDACGTATLTFNDVTTNGCGGSYTRTRTWTATDGCGNHSSASQTITVVDNTAPVITGVGANTTIDCPASPAFSSPVSTDACGSSTLTFADVTTTGICPGNYVTTRTWTATDGCGNHSSASQTITVHDVTAPVITCPATIYLCASDLSPALTNATATDGCSSVAISHTACPSNFPTGTTPITWTATDLCGNTASCVQNVVRNSAITVSIAASGAISGYCQGSNAVTLTATGAGGTGTLSYLWSTGATSQSIFVNVTGSYTCTVTDQFGHPCSASATYVFQTNSSSDLSSYTIIGRDKVHLHGYNVVQNGGIGATTVTGSASSGHQGWVKVHDHSSMNALTTFARAASIEVDGTSLVMNQILSAANPTLPAFDNGLPPNTTNVNVPAFTTVTLNATTYGDITVGAGATLIFGHATVDLKNLYVAHDATVQFAQACTRLRMSSQLDLDRNVVFNPDADGKDVAVYLKHINNEGSGHGSANYSFGYGSGGGALTSVNVEYGASVKAFIYAPNGKIDVHGGASGSTATNGNTSSAFSSTATTTMKGLFIARSVKAHGRTNWNWNTVCSSCNYALRETEGDAASSLKSEELTSGLLIENFPDPFQDKTTIRFVMDKDTHATVNVYDLNGKFITTVFSGDVTAKKEYKLEFDGSGLSNGMYIYKVITADDVHTGKMLLIKE